MSEQEETSLIPSSTVPLRNRRVKITIIGAGSPYCMGLLQGFIQQAAFFRGCHITLMDINKDNLELMYTLGSKLIQHAEVDLTLERTTSRKSAISDTDFVLTMFRTGGMPARHIDETVPLKHGLIGQEIVGVGGFFYALRTIPTVAQIAAEMEKVAPKAFLLNYSNPTSIVTEAITQSSGIRVIGLCDAPQEELRQLAHDAGITISPFSPQSNLNHRTIGLNHANWTTAFWLDGINIMPQLLAYCEQYARQSMTADNYEQVMSAILATRYQAIPAHYMHYYYFPDLVLKYQQKKSTSRAQDLMAFLPDIFAHYRKEAQKDVPQITKTRDSGGFSDFALNILRSILHNTGEEWVLNVSNNGAIDFLAQNRIVELPCRVDTRGAMPFVQGDGGIAVDQRGLLAMLAEYEAATAQVALWGTKRDAIRALAAHPLVLSYHKAEQVYEDMAAAHKRFLPKRLVS